MKGVITIYTYQDLLTKQTDKERKDFVLACVNEHRNSKEYKNAKIADDYYRRQNTTIVNYQNLLYTLEGKAVPDNYSANYKLCSGFFRIFVTQKVQYLLGNGVNWQYPTVEVAPNTEGAVQQTVFDEKSKTYVDKWYIPGTDWLLGKDFDTQLQKLAKYARRGGKAYGFWNLDHLDVFKFTEFKELLDENTGALMAGVRFWQIDDTKPLRATLYELDGYTEFIWYEKDSKGKVENEGRVLREKTPYILNIVSTEIGGDEIRDGENYPTFPIVPLWANEFGDSDILGLRENIDCFDLIKSGYANTIDEASMIYWTLSNAGGMTDIDMKKFIERMKVVKAAALSDDVKAEAHTIDLPYEAREAILKRLEKDMYRDNMVFDPTEVIGGASTATQIKAAYEAPDDEADDFEYQVIEFISHILNLAGIEDSPTFTRSKIVNTQEEISTLLQAGQYLPADYITEKVLTILGDIDRVEEVLAMMDEADISRLNGGGGEWTMDTENPTED